MKEFYKAYVKVTSNDIFFYDNIIVRAEDIKDARDEALMIVWNKIDKGSKIPYCIKDLGEDRVDIIPTFVFSDQPAPIVNLVYKFYFEIEKLRYE